MRACNRCLKTKPDEDFYLRERGRRRKDCRLCVQARVRARRASPADRAAYNASQRDYYARRDQEAMRVAEDRKFRTFYLTLKGRAAHMLNNARSRARRDGQPCALTRDWIIQRLVAGACEVTGLPFEMKAGHGRGSRVNAFSPSIDRIQASGPYTMENCRMTCWIFNRSLSAFGETDFERMCRAYLAKKDA